MKKIVATRADKNISEVAKLTHPILKRYADFCNADFTVITSDVPTPKGHYRILETYDLLNDYDRVLLVDTDIIIKKDCPDLFNMVPFDKIGTIFEDKGSRKEHRRSLIKSIQDERDSVGWESGYINTGVFLVSKPHQKIFDLDIEEVWMGFGEDDVELGYQIRKNKFEIFELDYTYNMLSMFSEPWNNNKSRFDAFIIHYAGGGWHRQVLSSLDHIKQDLSLLKKFKVV